MHHYPHHIGDYRSHTAHLSNDEDLAYRRLLEMYYDTEQPIPLDTQWVSRRLRVYVSDVETVLNDFFEKTEDGWVNQRCEKEIAEYRRISERNRLNGMKGGRKKNPVGSQSQPSGNPDQRQPITNNQYPITNNQEDQNTIVETEKPVSTPSKPKLTFDYSTERFENLTPETVNGWREAYPAIDVRNEIAKAKAWLLANPKNRKSNVQKFLNSWLSRAQDKAPRIENANTQRTNQPNQKLSLADRVRANCEQYARERGIDPETLGETFGHVRPQVHEPVRGQAERNLGDVLEGDFWPSNG